MRKVSLFIILLATIISVQAAPRTFSVQPPKWTELAVSNTDGVNIRKAPSTTAPRRVARVDPDDWGMIGSNSFWSSAKIRGDDMVMTFSGPNPVLSEKDGWLELEGVGPDESNGWVSAKFCDIEKPWPLTPGKYNTDNFMWITDPKNSDGGNYAIFCVFLEMDGFCVFFIGRESNGVLVCPYSVACQSEYSDDEECNLIKSSYGFEGSEHYRFIYGSAQSNTNGFDLNKLPAKAIDNIISAATEVEKPVIVYRMNGVYSSTANVY